jgi:tetratricopeptide (TPR) repeat protein
LKQNEFLVWLDQAATWISENKRHLINAAGVVLAAGVLLAGISYFTSSRQQAAQELLDEALELYHARIQESSVVTSAEGPEFANVEDRYRESLTAFENVIEEYSGAEQGRQARYYAALCHVGLEQYEQAEGFLDEVTGGRARDILYFLASQVLAVTQTERGNYEAAVDIYRRMVEDANNPLPKDQILFKMARVNEQAGDLEEAHRNYQRLLEEFPDSQLTGDVRQRDELIEFRLERST